MAASHGPDTHFRSLPPTIAHGRCACQNANAEPDPARTNSVRTALARAAAEDSTSPTTSPTTASDPPGRYGSRPSPLHDRPRSHEPRPDPSSGKAHPNPWDGLDAANQRSATHCLRRSRAPSSTIGLLIGQSPAPCSVIETGLFGTAWAVSKELHGRTVQKKEAILTKAP